MDKNGPVVRYSHDPSDTVEAVRNHGEGGVKRRWRCRDVSDGFNLGAAPVSYYEPAKRSPRQEPMPPKRLPRTVATERLVLSLTGLVVVAVLALGIWSASLGATDNTPTIERNVSDRYDDIEALDATRTTVVERNGTVTSTTVYDATLVPSTGERRLRLLGGETERYDLRVSNGSVLWLHEADRANVTRIPLDGRQGDKAGGTVQRLLVRAGLVADRGAESAPAVEPLPVVPASPGGGHAVGPNTNYEVTYAGIETVGDRETYVLTVTPRGNGSTAYRQTLWIDTEWFYPLKRQTAWTEDGVERELTTTYTDVTVNPSRPDGTFRPELTANTTVETVVAPETESYAQRQSLESATAISVPEPEIPPSYELAYGTHTDGAVRGVGLRYVNRTSAITVAKYNFTYAPDGDGNVTVDGRPATLSVGPTTSLSWNCETYRYTVRGTGVTTDQLVAVAESVGCPGG